MKNLNVDFLALRYGILCCFWLIFIIMLIAVVTLFMLEIKRVNLDEDVSGILTKISTSSDPKQITELYKKLMTIKYPLVDFSLMSFVSFDTDSAISDWSEAWAQRLNNINLAYSYIFITLIIAFIGFIFYIIIIIKIQRYANYQKRYNLSTKFNNDYIMYDIRIYLNFVTSLAILFSFFNFLSTFITLIYGAILLLSSYFIWYVLRINTEVLVRRKWWKTPNLTLFLFILLFQNTLSFLKVFFATKFDVNLELILKVLFPIGGITVMLVILIRNLLETQVKAVRLAIRTINARVTAFRIFYYSQKEKSLEDYTFVTQLPVLIKDPFARNAIDTKEAFKIMQIIDEATIFFEQHFEKQKERNYMLYHLFNEITDVKEIEEIKSNRLKIEAQRKKKKQK